MQERIAGIIKTAGTVATAEYIKDEYNKQTGRNITLPAIRMIVKALADSGELESQELPVSKQTHKLVKAYSMPKK